MNPLSATASIIAILQLSSKVLGYLNDIKNASKDRAKCTVEILNLYTFLFSLRCRLEEGSSNERWYTKVRALRVEDGPLDQFKQALEQLQAKLTGGGALKKAADALVWKFSKEVTNGALDQVPFIGIHWIRCDKSDHLIGKSSKTVLKNELEPFNPFYKQCDDPLKD